MGRFGAAIDLLNQAVARNPSFFDAYCQLAWAHDELYFSGFDHTPARLDVSRSSAFKLHFAFVQMMVKRTSGAGVAVFIMARLDYGGALS